MKDKIVSDLRQEEIMSVWNRGRVPWRTVVQQRSGKTVNDGGERRRSLGVNPAVYETSTEGGSRSGLGFTMGTGVGRPANSIAVTGGFKIATRLEQKLTIYWRDDSRILFAFVAGMGLGQSEVVPGRK